MPVRTKQRIPESILWLAVTVVFTLLVHWWVDDYRDTHLLDQDAILRRSRDLVRDQFACNVAVLTEQACNGNEQERCSAVLGLGAPYCGGRRCRIPWRHYPPDVQEHRRKMGWLIQEGYPLRCVSDVLPPLIRALKDRSTRVRSTAAEVLREMLGLALPARSALRECLHDSDPTVRLMAVQAVHCICFETEGLVEVALGILECGPDQGLRREAAYTLRMLGADGASVIATLAARNGADSDMARWVRQAFGMPGRESCCPSVQSIVGKPVASGLLRSR